MFKSILGIDVSKDKLDAVLLQEDSKHHIEIENNRKGFKTLDKWLRQHKSEIVHGCMEATGTYFEAIAEHLHKADHQVSVVNPARIKAYANSMLRRHKTDKGDAWVIADFCRAQSPSLWSPPSPAVRELRSLTRHLDDVKTMRQQQKNRLKSGATSSLTRLSLKKTIRFFDTEIRILEKRIQEHIKQHPELKEICDLLITIPGIAHLTACKLIAEIQDIELFDHPKQLAAYAGVHPSQYQSGSSIRGKSRMSKKGNKQLRTALFFPAIVAIQHNSVVQAAAQRHIARGNCKMSAIGVAMRKLLHIVWGVWKSRQPFIPFHSSERLILA